MTRTPIALARLVVRAAAWLAPARQRARWREEWLGEIDATASGRRPRLLRDVASAPIDALLLRRSSHGRGAPSPRSTLLPGLTDWRLAWRRMRRAPVVTGAAMLALAVGIGLSLVAWTVVRGVFYLPLPGPDGARLYRVTDYDRAGGFSLDVDIGEFTRRQRLVTSFTDLGAFNERPVTIGATDVSRVVTGASVTPNTFRLLSVVPRLGRDFHDDESRAGSQVVLVRETLAVREFGSASKALGAMLAVDGRPRLVVGILPDGCRFPFISDLWLPFAAEAPEGPAPERSLRMFGLLAPGVSPDAAADEMRSLLPAAPMRPHAEQLTVIVAPFGRPPGPPEQQYIAWGVIAIFVLLLAVAAATVAHLMLARAIARRHELAVCLALGASRPRLIVQLCTETLALCLAAAVLGTAGATVALRWLQRTIPDLPYWVTFEVGRESLFVVAGLTVLAAAVVGLGPAVRATGRQAALTSSARTSTLRLGWMGTALIAIELAVAVGFLTTAATLGRGLREVGAHSQQLPFDEVAVAQLYYGAPPASTEPGFSSLPADRRRVIWREHEVRAAAAQRELAGALMREPGVQAVALASHFPGNEPPMLPVETDRGTGETPHTRVVEIGAHYLDVLETRAIAGRDFTRSELETRAPVALVNDLFARRYFESVHVVDRRVRITVDGQPGPWRQIVGVVPDLGLSPAAPSRSDGVYIPLGPTTVVRVGVRRPPDPRVVGPAIHGAARRREPRATVQWTQTLADQFAEPVLLYRGLGGAVLAMGAVALLLACTGMHALVAFTVAQRRREIAVRLALGATRIDVVQSVLTRTFAQLGGGALLGGAIAVALDRGIQLPFDLERTGAATLAGVLLLLVAAALGACIAPLRRALSFGPAETLRDA